MLETESHETESKAIRDELKPIMSSDVFRKLRLVALGVLDRGLDQATRAVKR